MNSFPRFRTSAGQDTISFFRVLKCTTVKIITRDNGARQIVVHFIDHADRFLFHFEPPERTVTAVPAVSSDL